MPAVSERQRKAMYAAAAGRSTLGIPKSVGKDFVAATPAGKLPATAPKRKPGRPHKPLAAEFGI